MDDLVHLDPEHVGLKLILLQSKTTGPGKRVRAVPVFIVRDACLTGADWLGDGMAILDGPEYTGPRTGFVWDGSADFSGPTSKVLDAQSLAWRFRAVLSRLRRPRRTMKRTQRWAPSLELLLVEDAALYWSGHSPRHTLPSWSASMGVPKEERDFLGRWNVGLQQSSHYIMTIGCRGSWPRA